MKVRLSRYNGIFLIIAGIALVALLFGLDIPPFRASSASQQNLSFSKASAVTTSKIIIDENAHQGSTGWRIPIDKESTTQIQAYAGATSVQPGRTITFYVSTIEETAAYSVDVYRIGWYGGDGGRLMTSVKDLTGHAQGYYNASTNVLVGCASCYSDAQTGLVEARWKPSYVLNVAADWTTGVYLAKFSDADGWQTYVPFDVLGNTHASYVAVTADTTYQAYNEWGGYSLYAAYLGPLASTLKRGVKVSFDRPYIAAAGSSQVLTIEANMIHWMERQGYDLSYISSVDLHEKSAQLLQHHAYLSLGHDEYWSKEMRDGVEHARNSGIGLAFLGANASYWQIRFEPDDAGTPDRTIVCYKVESGHDLARDPLYGKDNARVTAQWRDPVVKRPENALIGIMYSASTQKQRGFPWRVNPLAASPLLQGTGLQPGQSYGCGLVGNEWDHVFNNQLSPTGLQVLAVSRTIDNQSKTDIGNTTYYIASTGAMVFATGSIYWTTALDDYRFRPDELCQGQALIVPDMQKLMVHVMGALIVDHLSS